MNDIKRGEMFYISRGGASQCGQPNVNLRQVRQKETHTRPCMNSYLTD